MTLKRHPRLWISAAQNEHLGKARSSRTQQITGFISLISLLI
jgi:hypothetical protein